jgi:hypothetical protein
MPINWLTVGSLYGAAGVAFGAFGAHGLKSRGISDAKIGSWSTAAHYQVSSSQIENDENENGRRKKRRRTPSISSHQNPQYYRMKHSTPAQFAD